MPSLFLEHFKELDKAVKNIRLSNSINTIFCCNGLYKNEVFKYFTALELEKGSKLICGQHGGNYGISNFLSGELHEIEISDKFLSWGWQKRNDKKIVPYSSFKILNQKINKNISSKKILIVLDALDKYLINNNSNRSDYITTNIYIKFIIKFLKKIPKQLRNYIYLKPHPSENKKNIVPIKDILMSEFNNEYKFINVGVDMFSIINDYKFIILTTNNTSFLEMIGLDKPCILLVNKEISFLRNNVLENFSNLAKANIYHTSINSCVKHILKINNKINDWWENKKTIEVKTKFKKKFANNEDKDLKKLSFILKNVE